MKHCEAFQILLA